MSYLWVSLVPALLAMVPLFYARQPVAAFLFGGLSFGILWLLNMWCTPALVYPLWGASGLMGTLIIVLGFVLASLISQSSPSIRERRYFGEEIDDRSKKLIQTHNKIVTTGFVFVVLVLLAYIGSWAMTWSWFGNAEIYANLIGPIERREWTEDVQPKDKDHAIMVTPDHDNALANTATGQFGGIAIGSQYVLSDDYERIQTVHDRQTYVTPLDYAGLRVWWTTGNQGVPAYVDVDAQDPFSKNNPKLVTLSDEHHMLYTPGAYWGHNLERHVRLNGYADVGLTNTHIELDDSDQPWWIITTYELAVYWSGVKVTGALVVNPHTGEITPYKLGETPEWVDRVISSDVAYDYVDYHGAYDGGWWNAFFNKMNLTGPDSSPYLVYNSDHTPNYVVGVTALNHDTSLVSMIYINSKNGKAVEYDMAGGATHRKVIDTVNANEYVSNKHLHGGYQQVYNVYGQRTAIVVLNNDAGMFQGVAMVNIVNPVVIGVGQNATEATIKYSDSLRNSGEAVTIDKSVANKELEGAISLITSSCGFNGNSTYFFTIGNEKLHFSIGSQQYALIPFVKPGDLVKVSYLNTTNDITPVVAFEVLSK